MKSENRLIEFYRLYPVEYWRYKLFLLKTSLEECALTKNPSQDQIGTIDNKAFTNMLKAEIHFTYFQMIETLFEMIFGLENQDDINLWYLLTFSSWIKNFQRIRNQIAKRKISFLDKEIELPKNLKITLTQYIFYYLYDVGLNESDMQTNLDIIKNALVLFAKDFSDRDDYNAYKHSLRLYHTPIRIGIAPEGSENYQMLGSASDAFSYLEKDENDRLREVTKPFDAARDFKMGMLCYNLIYNIIIARRRVFFKTEDLLFKFDKVDLQTLNIKRTNLGKFSFTI